jgi:hypothetical protein
LYTTDKLTHIAEFHISKILNHTQVYERDWFLLRAYNAESEQRRVAGDVLAGVQESPGTCTCTISGRLLQYRQEYGEVYTMAVTIRITFQVYKV